MPKGRWITPDETGDSNIARCLSVPEKLQPAVNWALEQLTFTDNWEQIGDLTPDDCAAAFVDVLSAYYESENCLSIVQTETIIIWKQGTVISGNALAWVGQSANELAGAWSPTTGAINDEVQFELPLKSGTYDLTIHGRRLNNSGVQHWIIDGVEDAQTIDMYASSGGANYEATISVTIVGDGIHTLSCKMSSKNASSSSYRNEMTYLKLKRTGD